MKAWLVAMFLALPGLAGAAGLGKLTVKSALGEPLVAEIELVAVQRDEVGSLSAKLGSRDVFAQHKLEYLPVLASFQLSVEMRPDATPYIKITSTLPVNEPFVDMLVELTWSAGKLLREYTFLLDPPEPGAPRQAAPPAEMKPMAPAAEGPAPAPPPVTKPGEGVAGTYGPVRRGDTLSKIALATRPQGVSLDQMLVALYRANPEAFMGKNMNRLKTGPILRLPDSGEITVVDSKGATTEVRAQAADWNAYRQKLAGAAVPVVEAPKQAAEGKITTKVEEKAAPAREPSKEVLKLSKGEPPSGQKETRSSEARLQALQEENIAKEKALKEANERVAQLENNIKEMRKLLELKGAAPPQKPAAAPAAKPAEPVQPEAAKPEAPKPEAQKPAEPTKSEAGAPAVEKPAEAKPTEVPKPVVPKPAAPKPPPPEPSFLESLLGNPVVGGGVALIAALLGAAGFLRYRRGKQVAPSPPMEPAVAPIEPTGAPAVAPAAVEEKPAPAEEVDPLSEADVYLAYGRDVQAEEILNDALTRQPGRSDLHLKLLEIYSKRRDKTAFEKTARTLQGLGVAGAAWESVQAMGLALDPQNPLYGGAPAAEPAPAPAAAAPAGIDFDLGAAAPAPEAPAPVAEASAEKPVSLDFDLGAFSTESPPAVEKPAEVAAAAEGLMFDITAVNPDQAAAQPTALDVPLGEASGEPKSMDISLGDIKLDLGGDHAATPSLIRDARWQEVATKFDLAKMYKEMGDRDGAKEILQEVIREGDPQQQQEAKTLLATL